MDLTEATGPASKLQPPQPCLLICLPPPDAQWLRYVPTRRRPRERGMAVRLSVVGLVGLAALLMVVDGQPPNMVFGDDPRKPVEINDELLCEVCHAVFSVVGAKLGNKKTETAVYDAVDGVCDQSNFRVFKMIPPTMKKGCDAFMDKHGDGGCSSYPPPYTLSCRFMPLFMVLLCSARHIRIALKLAR